jgi:hypothetical protein
MFMAVLPPLGFRSLAGLFGKFAIHQVFNELYALEFHQPGILLDMTVERHPDFPRP